MYNDVKSDDPAKAYDDPAKAYDGVAWLDANNDGDATDPADHRWRFSFTAIGFPSALLWGLGPVTRRFCAVMAHHPEQSDLRRVGRGCAGGGWSNNRERGFWGLTGGGTRAKSKN